MYCDNVTCKYNQLGIECTKLPAHIEFMCKDRYVNFNEKEQDAEASDEHNE